MIDEPMSRWARWIVTLSSPQAFIATAILLALFNVYHFYAIPACFTYDSFEYLRLADLLGTDRFDSEYYFSRPPLYPALLRGSFEVFGRNSFAAQVPGMLFGYAGVLLLGLLMRRWNYPLLALAGMVFISLASEFIAYQHTVLTEAGTFFFLTLAFFALLYPRTFSWRTTFLTAIALGVGYYQRPTIVYLSPVFAVLVFARWRESNVTRKTLHGLCGALLALSLPFVIAYPWMHIVKGKPLFNDMGRLMLGFGILKGVLYPPDDPILANYRELYIKAIADSSSSGRLDAAGLTQISFVNFQWGFMSEHADDAGKVLLDGALKYPWRYTKAVGRCMIYFLGRNSSDDDNMNVSRNVFDRSALGTSLKETSHPSFSVEAPFFKRSISRSILAKILNTLAIPLRWLLIAGSVLTCIGFLIGLKRRDLRLFAATAIPLAFLFSHAVVLLSVNRYAFPALPLIWLNLLLVPVLIRYQAPITSTTASTQTNPTLPAA